MPHKMLVEKCAPAWCADCEQICPNQAININSTVDPERCTECVGSYPTPRCIEVCPMGAFVLDPEYHETKEQLLEKWCRLHPGEEPAPGTY